MKHVDLLQTDRQPAYYTPLNMAGDIFRVGSSDYPSVHSLLYLSDSANERLLHESTGGMSRPPAKVPNELRQAFVPCPRPLYSASFRNWLPFAGKSLG